MTGPDPRIAYLLAHAHYQREAGLSARALLVLMFLAWWVPASLSGWLPWFGQPLVWIGLAGALRGLGEPARATVEQAEQLRSAGARSTNGTTLRPQAPHQAN